MPASQTKSAVRKRAGAQAVGYSGKLTRTGNSTGFRFEQALFKSHPEFSGEVRAHVIAPGRLLVTVETAEEPDDEDDPVIAAFLAFLNRDMLAHPENIKPLDENRSREIKALIEGVVVDEDEDLGEETLI
jgi:antitoxin PrlF